MNSIVKTSIASLLSITLGVSAIYFGTDGFQALTAEQARRYQAKNDPVNVAPIELINQQGVRSTAFKDNDRITFVNFIFTQCLSICQTSGSAFYRLQSMIEARGLSHRYRLVSISFDPERDTVPKLSEFAEKHGAAADLWYVARLANSEKLDATLDRFEVIVLEDPLWRFVHNSAIHVVSPDGRIISIEDADDAEAALAAADGFWG